MAVLGAVTPTPGTGSKTFSLGAAYSRVRVTVGGLPTTTAFTESTGVVLGSVQKVFSRTATYASNPLNECIQWLDPSTNAVLMEAVWTAWTGTGVTFNFTTIPAAGSIPQVLLEAD